jgi:predicted TIM-barrel fold metal-dependent hydrolase
MNKVDVHCHFFPPQYVPEVDKRHYFKTRPLPPVWDSSGTRIAYLNKVGIGRQVLSLSSPLVYFNDDSFNLFLSQMANDFLMDICRQAPDRFSGFYVVPLRKIKDAMDELNRIKNAPHMEGIVIGTHIDGKELSSAEFVPFFEEANRQTLTIFLHPVPQVGIENIQEYRDFFRSLGFLWETTTAVARMAISGVFEKYPNITWILSHLGGTIPFVYTSFDIGQKRNYAKEYVPPEPISRYLRKLYVDTARQISAPILECAVDLYGPDHILYGTDLPFAYEVTELNVTLFEKLPLSTQLKEQIFSRNAEKLFKYLR